MSYRDARRNHQTGGYKIFTETKSVKKTVTLELRSTYDVSSKTLLDESSNTLKQSYQRLQMKQVTSYTTHSLTNFNDYPISLENPSRSVRMTSRVSPGNPFPSTKEQHRHTDFISRPSNHGVRHLQRAAYVPEFTSPQQIVEARTRRHQERRVEKREMDRINVQRMQMRLPLPSAPQVNRQEGFVNMVRQNNVDKITERIARDDRGR